MTDPIFDHDRLDVYRLSIEYVAAAFDVSKSLGVYMVTPATNGFARLNRFR